MLAVKRGHVWSVFLSTIHSFVLLLTDELITAFKTSKCVLEEFLGLKWGSLRLNVRLESCAFLASSDSFVKQRCRPLTGRKLKRKKRFLNLCKFKVWSLNLSSWICDLLGRNDKIFIFYDKTDTNCTFAWDEMGFRVRTIGCSPGFHGWPRWSCKGAHLGFAEWL